jgi:hypothetical protein
MLIAMTHTRPVFVYRDDELVGVFYQSAGNSQPWREWYEDMVDLLEGEGVRMVIGLSMPRNVLYHARIRATERVERRNVVLDDAYAARSRLMKTSIDRYLRWSWRKFGAKRMEDYNRRAALRESRRKKSA